MAKLAQSGLLILFVALLGAPVRAQLVPDAPPPAAPPPATGVPIEPITGGPLSGSAPLGAAPLLTPTPSAPMDAPPLTPTAAPAHEPFYTKWWFWTAVGAVAVTTLAIVIATSGSSPPHTDFGNMPAF